MAGLREVLVSFGFEVDKDSERQIGGSLEKVTDLAKKAAAAFAAFKIGQMGAAFVDEIREMGDELDKTSIQLGLTTDNLQSLRHAANLAGVDGRAFSDSLAKLQKNAFAAADGNKTMIEQFEQLGVTVTDTSGKLKTADQLLVEMADGFPRLSSDSEKVALSLNLMGRTGRRLLPLFTQGAQGLKAARDETKKLGVGISQDVIQKSISLTDNQARAELAILTLKDVIAAELIPIFDRMALATIDIAVALRGPLIRAVDGAKRIFRGINLAIDTVMGMFDSLGQTIIKAAAAFSLLGVAFAITGKQGFLAGLKAAAGWLIATAPAILFVALLAAIGAAILLVIEDLQMMGEGGESVIGTIIEGFNELVSELGSIPAAIDEMLGEAAAFWIDRFNDMFGFTEDTVENLKATFGSLLQTTIGFWSGVGDAIMEMWQSVTDFVMSLWQATVNALDFAFGGAVRAVIAAFQALFAFLTGNFEEAATFAVVAMQEAWSQIQNTFTMLLEWLKLTWEFWTSTVPAAIGQALSAVWGVFTSIWTAIFDWLRGLWKAQFDLIVQIVQFAFEGLKGWFTKFFEFLGSLWTTAIKSWADVIRKFVGGVIDKFSKVTGFFGNLFGGESEEREAPRGVAASGTQRPFSAPGGTGVPEAPVPGPTGAPVTAPVTAPGPAPVAAPGAPVTAPGPAPVIAPQPARTRVAEGIAAAMGAATPQEAGQRMTQGATALTTVASVGASAATTAPVAMPAPGGATSITSSPNTSIDVSVDATGRDRPDAIAEQVAAQVDAALERRDRQTLRAFTTAVAAGGA